MVSIFYNGEVHFKKKPMILHRRLIYTPEKPSNAPVMPKVYESAFLSALLTMQILVTTAWKTQKCPEIVCTHIWRPEECQSRPEVMS